MRKLSLLDRVLSEIDHTLVTSFASPNATRPNPAKDIPESDFTESQRKHVSGLMRVDHTGEICAQALYRGQALFARDPQTKAHLLHAADEEQDHLVWCADRLKELSARTTILSPVWYGLSFGIGVVAGLKGDDWSYGFVAETEDQVEAHLTEHLEDLPRQDKKSRAILKQMKKDEASHAKDARHRGGRDLPVPVKCFMKLQSKVMTKTAYYI